MSHPTPLQQMSLEDVAQRCAQETARFFQRQHYDPQYCFEMFRRAIQERDERAWELLHTQYGPLVAGWVVRHPAFPSSGEDSHYFCNRAFEKLWMALTPERFSRFADLRSLLRYLQTCVHSVILDQVRRAERAAAIQMDVLPGPAEQATGSVEGQVLDQAGRQAFWQEINARLHDDKERQVVYGSFVLALKPRELCAEFPGTFRDVTEVYRIKENVLARLRRDPGLKRLLGENA